MDEQQESGNSRAQEIEVREEDQEDQDDEVPDFLDTVIDWYFIEKWDVNSKESKTEHSRRLALEFMRMGDVGREPYVKKYEARHSTGELAVPFKRLEEVPADALTGQERLAAYSPDQVNSNGGLIRTVFGEEADKLYEEKFASFGLEGDMEDTCRVFVKRHPHLEVGDAWEEALCFLSGLYIHDVWDVRYDGVRAWAIIIDPIALSSGKARVIFVDGLGTKRYDRRVEGQDLGECIQRLWMFNTSNLDEIDIIYGMIDEMS